MKNYLKAIVLTSVVLVCENTGVHKSNIIEKRNSTEKYECSDGVHIGKENVCNGAIDCRDTAEDEKNCERCSLGSCQVGNGSCVKRSVYEDQWHWHTFSYFKYYCKTKDENERIETADCTRAGLVSLPCFDNSTIELILNENEFPSDAFTDSAFANNYQLTVLELESTNITNLPPNVFQNLKNLKNLSLSHNQIQFLDENVFKNLLKLQILNLENNNISNPTLEMFRYVKNLENLNLARNTIRYLDEMVFQNSLSMKFLDLSGNNITTLPPNIFQNLTTLSSVLLSCNQIEYLNATVFQNLHYLRILKLDNNRISYLPRNMFANLNRLQELWLKNNAIPHLHEVVFQNLSNLESLNLENNLLSNLPANLFKSLTMLTRLDLASNRIRQLDKDVFQNLYNLRKLYLNRNKIVYLSLNVFQNLKNLVHLELEENQIQYLDAMVFANLLNLELLNLKKNQIGEIHRDVLKNLKKLKVLIGDDFRFCCLSKEIEKCEAPSNEFSSCDHLLKNGFLRTSTWILGSTAIVANIIVIYVRWKSQNAKTNKANLFLILNLAMSGLIMGVYLLMIAITDASYNGEYYIKHFSWLRSYWCDLAGVLSILSSESTVFILTVISFDHLIAMMFPSRTIQRGLHQMKIVMTVVWAFAAIISLVPHQLFQIPYFKNFFGQSGVCLPLHITRSEAYGGREYSFFIFILLNAISFVVIVINYTLMYLHALTRNCGAAVPSDDENSNTPMAFRMTVLVLADAVCWIPIILVGIQSTMGYVLQPNVYPWMVIFVLPLNAALNPVLYAISYVPLTIASEFEECTETGQPSFRRTRELPLETMQSES